MSKSFHVRVREVFEHPRPTLSFASNRLIVTHGVGKRLSMCRICSLPIPKGPRIEIYSRFPVYMKFARGGGSGGSIHFVHHSCLRDFIDAEPTPATSWRSDFNHCFRCGSELELNTATHRVKRTCLLSLTNHSVVTICLSCANEPGRFRLCWGCDRYFYPERVSLIVNIEDGFSKEGVRPPDARYLCDHCDSPQAFHHSPVETLRSVRRDKLLRRKVQRQYDETQTWVDELGAVHAERSSNG